MAVTVLFEGKASRVKAAAGSSVADVLRLSGINPQTALVRLGCTIVPDDHKVKEGEKLEVMRVVSGG